MDAGMMTELTTYGEQRQYFGPIPNVIFNEGNFQSVDVYTCTDCGFSCKSKWELQKHKKTHRPFSTGKSSQPLHKCEICGYSSIWKSDLTRHRRTHTGERPFKCQWCPYSATQQANLTKHERIHDCGICDFRSGDKLILLSHRKTHHI